MIGVKMRARRKELGITQQELADQIGVKQSFISSLESNKQTTSIDLFLKITNALKINPCYFFEDEQFDHEQEERDHDYFVEDTIEMLEDYFYSGRFHDMHQLINHVGKTEYFQSKIQKYRLEQYKAKAYFGQKQYIKSLEILNVLTTQTLPYRDSYFKSETLRIIGVCYLKLEKLDLSIAYLKEAYDTVSKVKYRYENVLYHKTLYFLGIAYLKIGKKGEAIRYLEESKRWIESLLTHSYYGDSLLKICDIYISNKTYTEATKTSEQAAHYFQLINDTEGLYSTAETGAKLANKTN